MKMTFALRMVVEAATRLGYMSYHEPRYGYTGFVEFPSGIRRYVRDTTTDLNTTGAARTARDKDYTCMFLSQAGIRTVRGVAVYAKRWARAIGESYDVVRIESDAQSVGYPLILKPNDGTNGNDIYMVTEPGELIPQLDALHATYDIVRMEEHLVGSDVRIVVLDGQVLLMLKRLPPEVCGDGIQTLRSLVATQYGGKKNYRTRKRIHYHVLHAGYDLGSVIPQGKRIVVLPSNNLSHGGHVSDVTDALKTDAVCEWARGVAHTLNLRWCAIDCIVGREEDVTTYTILEVNSSPSFKRFALSSEEACKKVQAIYDKLVASMAS